MEIVLFILYTIALMLQLFLLGRAVKYPVSNSWTDLYATEIISAMAAGFLVSRQTNTFSARIPCLIAASATTSAIMP